MNNKKLYDILNKKEINLFPLFVLLAKKIENYDNTNISEYKVNDLLITKTFIKKKDRLFYKPISKY